jgi:hypothetical protein
VRAFIGREPDRDIVNVKVDSTAPVTLLRVRGPSFDIGPTFVAPGTVISLDSDDGFSGVNGTFYGIDGQPAKPYLTGMKESSPGHHNMTYWATDKAGNRGGTAALWFFVDNEAPVTDVSYNGPMATFGGKVFVSAETTISLVTIDSGSGVNRTEYKLDGGSYKRYSEGFKLASAGEHAITYRSYDNVENLEAETTLKVTVDKASPISKGTASSALSNEDIVVSLDAVDTESGVCGSYFRVVKEKATPGDFQNGSQLVIEAKSNGMADGNYTVQYYSVDNVGNRETTRELKVRIDTVAFLRVIGGDRQSVGKDSCTIKGMTEAGANVSVNGKHVTVSEDGSFSIEVSLKPGNNDVIVKVTDPTGNTATRTVHIDYAAPMTLAVWLTVALIIVMAGVLGWGAFRYVRKGKKMAPKGKMRVAKPPVKSAIKSPSLRK